MLDSQGFQDTVPLQGVMPGWGHGFPGVGFHRNPHFRKSGVGSPQRFASGPGEEVRKLYGKWFRQPDWVGGESWVEVQGAGAGLDLAETPQKRAKKIKSVVFSLVNPPQNVWEAFRF